MKEAEKGRGRKGRQTKPSESGQKRTVSAA